MLPADESPHVAIDAQNAEGDGAITHFEDQQITVHGADMDDGIGVSSKGKRCAQTMAEIEEEAIRRVLADVGGNCRRAAEELGIGLRTLYEKLKRFGIE